MSKSHLISSVKLETYSLNVKLKYSGEKKSMFFNAQLKSNFQLAC